LLAISTPVKRGGDVRRQITPEDTYSRSTTPPTLSCRRERRARWRISSNRLSASEVPARTSATGTRYHAKRGLRSWRHSPRHQQEIQAVDAKIDTKSTSRLSAAMEPPQDQPGMPSASSRRGCASARPRATRYRAVAGFTVAALKPQLDSNGGDARQTHQLTNATAAIAAAAKSATWLARCLFRLTDK